LKTRPNSVLRATLLAAAIAAALPIAAQAQADTRITPSDGARQLDAVVVTGTRRVDRSQFDTLSPVDVISQDELRAVESGDLNDVLAQLVPSFTVQRLPMADGQVFVRPAGLRGLSSDQTLVLVNGRRFHRSAFLGARGAQGPDLSQIPVHAVQRIEVLRDGASAQYGSDAIAGVINIILHGGPGSEVSLRASEYAAGDGRGWQVGGRTGVRIGEIGSVVLFAGVEDADATSRSRQRADAIAFQEANPGLDVPDPVQRWGQPELRTWQLGFNADAALGEQTEAYGFGIYGRKDGVSDFNWRNPTDAVFAPSAAFPGWDLRTLYPVGFSPQYGNAQRDVHLVGGVRGAFNDRLTWDVSASYGRNEIDYTLSNSINASLGPDSPTAFYLGELSQREVNFNADFVYSIPLQALDDSVAVAFGAERRSETYGVGRGDPASFAIGPGAATGLPPNANGAPGFSDLQAGRWTQDSHAAYVDVEVPLTARWSAGAALRYEDFSEFGDTVDGKLSTRFEIAPGFAVRGAYSTGFRAPTPGQLYSTSTTQGLDTVTLQVFNAGRLSPNDPIAIALGAKPLTPEESRSMTLGLAWQGAAGLSGSIDLYDIEVTDRFSQSASLAIPPGTPNPDRFTSVSYFTNDFDTVTRGVDVVGNYAHALGDGRLGLTLAFNYNKTEVDAGSTGVATNPTQRTIFEDRLPRQRGSFAADYTIGGWNLLGRLRHYGAWTDSSGNATGDIFQRFGDMQFLDVAVGYRFNAVHSVRAGADNVLDDYPDEATFQASRGLIYSRNAPYDTDGRNVYVEYRARF